MSDRTVRESQRFFNNRRPDTGLGRAAHRNRKEMDRKSVDRPNDLEWLRRKLGIIFQDSDVALFNSTVWNDVVFGPLHMGLPVEEIKARGNRALEKLCISHLRDRAPYRLSGGEKEGLDSVCSLDRTRDPAFRRADLGP